MRALFHHQRLPFELAEGQHQVDGRWCIQCCTLETVLFDRGVRHSWKHPARHTEMRYNTLIGKTLVVCRQHESLLQGRIVQTTILVRWALAHEFIRLGKRHQPSRRGAAADTALAAQLHPHSPRLPVAVFH